MPSEPLLSVRSEALSTFPSLCYCPHQPATELSPPCKTESLFHYVFLLTIIFTGACKTIRSDRYPPILSEDCTTLLNCKYQSVCPSHSGASAWPLPLHACSPAHSSAGGAPRAEVVWLRAGDSESHGFARPDFIAHLGVWTWAIYFPFWASVPYKLWQCSLRVVVRNKQERLLEEWATPCLAHNKDYLCITR